MLLFALIVFSSSIPVLLKGQKWNSDILTKQSKPSLVKSSSKLFFVSRLRGKKYKTGGSSKVLQDTSNTLETSQTPAQGPQKVHSTFRWLLYMPRPQLVSYCFCRTMTVLTFFSRYCFCTLLATQSGHAWRRGLLWPAESLPEQPHGWPTLFRTG